MLHKPLIYHFSTELKQVTRSMFLSLEHVTCFNSVEKRALKNVQFCLPPEE